MCDAVANHINNSDNFVQDIQKYMFHTINTLYTQPHISIQGGSLPVKRFLIKLSFISTVIQ